MTNSTPLSIPTMEELRAAVVAPMDSPDPSSERLGAETDRPSTDKRSRPIRLTPLAEAFLRQAVLPGNRGLGLETYWQALGVTSGSVKGRVREELRRHGFIRIERKGRVSTVHVYGAGYAYLGVSPPKGEGVGGTTHKRIVARLAAQLKKRGYEVHIEQEIGPARKRVDLLALGPQRIAIELGLSDAEQEARNILADLRSGAVDQVVFVAVDRALLRRVTDHLAKQTVYISESHRVRFYLWPDNEETTDEKP